MMDRPAGLDEVLASGWTLAADGKSISRQFKFADFSEAFGFISGIFFLGYFLFEVPSNVALNKYGARVWIARILVSWGLLAALTAFAQNATQLYILRFLLGVAEAGFFPGIIVYLTYWFPPATRARANALFMVGQPIAIAFGSLLSGYILRMDGVLGLAGWRWLFILEGVPSIVLGAETAQFDVIASPEWFGSGWQSFHQVIFRSGFGHALHEISPRDFDVIALDNVTVER